MKNFKFVLIFLLSLTIPINTLKIKLESMHKHIKTRNKIKSSKKGSQLSSINRKLEEEDNGSDF